jgi:hypothetical protein
MTMMTIISSICEKFILSYHEATLDTLKILSKGQPVNVFGYQKSKINTYNHILWTKFWVTKSLYTLIAAVHTADKQ